MENDKHKKEIIDWKMDRLLLNPEPAKCDCCEEESVYVDLFDISYRHMQMDTKYMQMCIDCYYIYIVIPMDEQWDTYHAGLL